MMNVFLTGESGAGKTTLIERFLQTYTGVLGGFRTKVHGDARYGIWIENVSTLRSAFSKVTKGTEQTCSKAVLADKGLFEVFGVHALSFEEAPGLILMDELGLLEEDCSLFKAQVHACLDAETNVLGVIKKKDGAFLKSVRAREDVTVLDIDQTPHEDVLHKLNALLSEGAY